MNTLRDTDEGRARPSVWPVYLVAAIIGLHGLSFLGSVVLFPLIAYIAKEAAPQASPEVLRALKFHIAITAYVPFFAVYGVFSVLTTVGALRLRPWSWWCGVVWTVLYAVYCIWITMALPVRSPAWTIALSVAQIALLLWLLATRRQLFFPTRPQGEE